MVDRLQIVDTFLFGAFKTVVDWRVEELETVTTTKYYLFGFLVRTKSVARSVYVDPIWTGGKRSEVIGYRY